MAAPVRLGNSVQFDATNTGIDLGNPVQVVGMTFKGTGLTAGQPLTVRDHVTPGSGNIIADAVVGATIDNLDLWGAKPPMVVTGLSITSATVAGTWTLTVFYR